MYTTVSMSASSISVRAPIPRGVRARERVLRAALEVLAERGMSGFTMEAVAEQAGASKATVYRHWKSRVALLVDAMDLAFPAPAPPFGGGTRAELARLIEGQADRLQGPAYPRLLAAVIDAAEREPALAAQHQDLTERRRRSVVAALRAAQERGEIRAGADLEVAVDVLAGALFYRRLVAHRDFPPGYTAAVLDQVLWGLAAP